MFVVELGSVLVTFLWLKNLSDSSTQENVFAGLVAAWLWFTVLFANFAEAVAEGRGKAQADELRKTRAATIAHRRLADGCARGRPERRAPARRRGRRLRRRGDPRGRRGHRGHRERRRVGDHRRVRARDPRVRRRPLGRHRRDARPLRPDRRARHRSARRELPRPHDRARRGRRAPEDAERDRAQHPARRAHDRLPALGRDAAAVRDLLERGAERHRARRAARLPHPDDDRRPPLGDRHRRHGPPRAPERARALGPGRRGGGRLLDAPPRQDRHDHARQPPGDGAHPAARA